MLEHDRNGPFDQTLQPVTPAASSAPATVQSASRDAVPISPLLPMPRRDLGYYQDDRRVQKFFGDQGVGYHLPVAALAHDQVWNDTYPAPYNGPLDLDNQGTAGPIETYEMRWLYRELYRREPSIRAAVKGKADAVACLDVSVIPQDDKNPADCEAAKFVKWTVENTLMGFDGMISQLVVHALIDGWSVMEKTLHTIKPERNRRYAGMWGLYHCRPLDTMFLRLQLDQFRNVLSVVNTVRGLEYYSADKFLLFSYSSLFNNPFGQSDLRACVRSCGLIQDAYQLWYLALKMFGLPYLHGKVDQPTNRKVMEAALAELRAGGFAVTSAKDDIQLLNLASAASFSAFEANIRAQREENFMAIRGAYLPFMEGVGGTDAHGNTSISKVASDTNVDLLAKSVARVLTHQLVPWLVRNNFPSGTGYPTITLGGVSWAEVASSLNVLLPMAKELRLPISRDQVYKRLNWAPPDGDDDTLDMNRIEAQQALIQGQVQLQLQQQQMAAQAQMQAQMGQQPAQGSEGQEGASQGQEQGAGEFEMSPPQEEQGGGEGDEFEMSAPQPAQMSEQAEGGRKEGRAIAAVRKVVEDLADDQRDGLNVYANADGPKFWIDAMDWHEGDGAKVVIEAAEKVARKKAVDGYKFRNKEGNGFDLPDGPGVYTFNESSPPDGWIDLTSQPAQMSEQARSQLRPGTRAFADKPGDKHKYACVYAPLGDHVKERLAALHEQIDPNDLADRGYETDPHVTVRYGLHGDDSELDASLKQLGETEPFEVRFGNPSVFAGKEYDVIKLDLLDGFEDELRALHDRLGDLNHTDKFKDYRPHLTVAYVKPGKGAWYCKRLAVPRTTLKDTVTKLVYSDRDKKKRTIPLRQKGREFSGPGVSGVPAAQVNRVLNKLLSEFAGAV